MFAKLVLTLEQCFSVWRVRDRGCMSTSVYVCVSWLNYWDMCNYILRCALVFNGSNDSFNFPLGWIKYIVIVVVIVIGEVTAFRNHIFSRDIRPWCSCWCQCVVTQPKPWCSCWCQCVVTQPKPWCSCWCQCVVTQPKPWCSCWCQCVVTQPKPWCSCWCQCVVTQPKPWCSCWCQCVVTQPKPWCSCWC